jgi:hypothetical protein
MLFSTINFWQIVGRRKMSEKNFCDDLFYVHQSKSPLCTFSNAKTKTHHKNDLCRIQAIPLLSFETAKFLCIFVFF